MSARERRFSTFTRSGVQPGTFEPAGPTSPLGGVTPPTGDVGQPGSNVPGWTPDLAKVENRLTLALMVKV